jgi:hypothetical protein
MRALISVLAPAFATAACVASDFYGQSHSLQSEQKDAQGNVLYFRHAGYVGWITPDEDAMDDADETFTIWAPLDNAFANAVSFENQPEFPGYYLRVNPSDMRIRLDPLSTTDPAFNLSATFLLRDNNGACALESAAYPGLFWTFFYNQSSAPAKEDTPCHYAVCTAVYAASPPANPPLAWNTSSTWQFVAPNGGPAAIPMTNYTVGDIALAIRNDTGTVSVLHALEDTTGFSFVPDDTTRNSAGYEHLGDITVRVRPYGSVGAFTQAATSVTGKHGPTAVPVPPSLPNGFAAFDVSGLLNIPGLRVVREYGTAADGNGGVVMSFLVSNTGANALEIGALGISTVFNNDWSGLSLEQNAQTCSLTEPYMGMDGGFVRVIKITGAGPLLLVSPAYDGCALNGGSVAQCGAPFAAWRILSNDPTPRSGTFEGFYEWTVLSAAWQANEWVTANPWNAPRNLVLLPGQSAAYSLRLSLAPSLEAVDSSLASLGNPVVRGIPGYVITPDMQTASLLVRPPSGWSISSIAVEPAGALTVGAAKATTPSGYQLLPVSVPVDATLMGRVRMSITYQPQNPGPSPALRDRVQTVQYYTLPSLPEHLRRYANFTATNVWFTEPEPFARTYSFMDYNAASESVIIQEARAFIAGLSDEAGAGTSLGFAVHSALGPSVLGVAELATYVNRTLIGTKPDGSGQLVSLQDDQCNTRASMFYSGAKFPYNYTVAPCWDEPRSETTWRSYNYVHPATLLLSLYRVARDSEGMVAATQALASTSNGQLDGLNTWQSYLSRSACTMFAMWNNSGPDGYCQFGLMVGDYFAPLIDALAQEAAIDPATWSAMWQQADQIQRNRTQIWNAVPFPYGSEVRRDALKRSSLPIPSHFCSSSFFLSHFAVSLGQHGPTRDLCVYSALRQRLWCSSLPHEQPDAIGRQGICACAPALGVPRQLAPLLGRAGQRPAHPRTDGARAAALRQRHQLDRAPLRLSHVPQRNARACGGLRGQLGPPHRHRPRDRLCVNVLSFRHVPSRSRALCSRLRRGAGRGERAAGLLRPQRH